MRIFFTFILISLFLYGCRKDKYFKGPDFYSDDFENYYILEELISTDDQLWSMTQQTRSSNTIIVDTSNSHNSVKSLKFFAEKSEDGNSSKCSISKQNMAFWDGETMRVTAWYFIEGSASLDWLFLLDVEEQVAVGAGPGIRIAMVNNQLRAERAKIKLGDITQPAGQEIDFPRDQWVELIWEVKLSQKKKGYVKLWQNGQLILEDNNTRTLPKDKLYFQQGTKGMMSSVEIGITANSNDNPLVIWVDDVTFEKIN